MDIFKLGDKILALLEAVFGFWNNQISLVFAMLGQSPVSFKGGGPWAVIEGIEPVFVAVGSSLVVLFFVIGFCSESIDVKDEMRFESILRMLIRLGLAEWFVANNVTIMKAFFTSIGNLVELISAGTTTQLAIDSTQADIIKGLGFGESLVMLILTALLAIIIIICGFFIIYTVYFRFLKILIIVPLGAIACSTMAGNRMVSHTMATYCKYFLSCVFEAVTMALAIVVCNAFINAGLTVFELSGVEPNPKIETVRNGVEICKNEGIDMVLAIGGGSTIDCSKVVAAGAKYDGDAWDLVLDGSKVKAALPIFDVLTLSATGTEMDSFAVISDMSKNEKWGTGSPYMVPTMSILNPEYTFSVSKKQTAAGTADMMSHTMENYFSMENADCQKFMAEGLLRTMIKNGPAALAQPDNYEARANLMWAGTHAINGVVGDGCSPAWCVHPMEHELSAFYDITHGEGLAILTPAWMEHILNDDTLPMFVEFAKNVWGLSSDDDYALAHAGIDALKKFFFETMGIPANLRAVGITDDRNFEVMAKKACEGSKGSFVPLSKDDIVEIYRAAF